MLTMTEMTIIAGSLETHIKIRDIRTTLDMTPMIESMMIVTVTIIIVILMHMISIVKEIIVTLKMALYILMTEGLG